MSAVSDVPLIIKQTIKNLYLIDYDISTVGFYLFVNETSFYRFHIIYENKRVRAFISYVLQVNTSKYFLLFLRLVHELLVSFVN